MICNIIPPNNYLRSKCNVEMVFKCQPVNSYLVDSCKFIQFVKKIFGVVGGCTDE